MLMLILINTSHLSRIVELLLRLFLPKHRSLGEDEYEEEKAEKSENYKRLIVCNFTDLTKARKKQSEQPRICTWMWGNSMGSYGGRRSTDFLPDERSSLLEISSSRKLLAPRNTHIQS